MCRNRLRVDYERYTTQWRFIYAFILFSGCDSGLVVEISTSYTKGNTVMTPNNAPNKVLLSRNRFLARDILIHPEFNEPIFNRITRFLVIHNQYTLQHVQYPRFPQKRHLTNGHRFPPTIMRPLPCHPFGLSFTLIKCIVHKAVVICSGLWPGFIPLLPFHH